MVDIEKFADEWGPEKVLQVYDPHTRMQGILVIDNTAVCARAKSDLSLSLEPLLSNFI